MVYNKEVTTGEEAKEKLLEGIEKLAEAVLVTMGPTGRTVIIPDEYGRPYVTKDGVSVANAIKFNDPIENIGAKLVKEVAQKTADEAGDGTTTSTSLALAFIRHGLELLQNEVAISDLQLSIDELVKETLQILSKRKKDLDISDVYKVATISANNDEGIGNLIQKAYNSSNLVKVEEGKQREDSIEVVNGMMYETTYMSNHFVTDDTKKESSYTDPNILVLDCKLTNLEPYRLVIQEVAKRDEGLVIFTEHVTDQILTKLASLKNDGSLHVTIIKAPGFGNYRSDNLKDIADFTGAKIVTTDRNALFDPSILGRASKVTASKLNTIISKRPEIDVSKKITHLKEQSKAAKLNDYDREILFDRINNLSGSLSIIRVGGHSELEMRERKDRIDDAVLAVKSALEEGIVEGGGVALIRAYNQLEKRKTLPKTIRGMLGVLTAPAYQINHNSDGKINADFKRNRIVDNIIDPYKVTRCALENAASVAKTILSTEAVVLNEQQWN